MSIYSRPCVDDYNYSADVYHLIKSGNANLVSILKTAWDVDVKFYNSWQGLYTSAFVLALQPGVFGEKHYWIGAVLLLLLIFLCVSYFADTMVKLIRNVDGTDQFSLSPLMAGLVTVAFILIGIPDITEGLYWFNGAWNYTPFFFLILVNVAWLLRYVNANKFDGKRAAGWKRWIYLFLSVVLSFLISGGNHVTGFLNILVLVTLVFVVLATSWKKWPVVFSLTSAMVGFFIMYKAPGTSIRQVNFQQPEILDTMKASLFELKSLVNLYIGIQWTFLMFVAVAIGSRIVTNITGAKGCPRGSGRGCKRFFVNPITSILVSIAIICGILCVPYYAMGNFGQGRVYNIFWLTFMTLSFFNIIYNVVWRGVDVRLKLELRSFVAGALLLTVLLSSANYTAVIRELKDGTAKSFAESCDARYEQMANAQPGEVCYAKALPMSECLYVNDVSWDNSAWTAYYGASLVLVE